MDQRRNKIHAAETEDILVTGFEEQKLASRQREAQIGLLVTPYQQAIQAALSTKK